MTTRFEHLPHRVSFPLLAALVAASALGCKSADDDTRLDITVQIDPALQLDAVAMTVSGGGKPTLPATFAVQPATGNPPAVAPVRWQIVVSNTRARFLASIEARGRRGSQEIVVAAADAWVEPAEWREVTLRLEAACSAVQCTGTATCVAGDCGPRPVFGGAVDGGGDRPTTDARQDAAPDATTDGGQDGSEASSDAASDGTDRPDSGSTGDAGGGPCANDDACGSSSYCAGGTCAPRKAAGASCTASTECAAGNCRDFVCCPATCTLSCQGCANAVTGAADGTCAVRTSSPPGTQVCDNQCIDVRGSDANNCGSCGHGCLGGRCENGSCQPVHVATVSGTVAQIAVNSTTLFGRSGDRAGFWSVPKSGGTPAGLPLTMVGNAMVVTDTHLAVLGWTPAPTALSGDVRLCTLPGCQDAQVVVPYGDVLSSVIAVHPSADRVFWVQTSANTVWQSLLSSWAPSAIGLNLPGVSKLAVRGEYLYALGISSATFGGQFLVRSPQDGSGVSFVLSAAPQQDGVVFSEPFIVSDAVVFSVFATGAATIHRVPLPFGVGNSPPPVLSGSTPARLALFADDAGVYWIDGSDHLVTCPTEGCSGAPTVVATSRDTALAGDAEALYWAVYDSTTSSSAILKIAR